MSVFSFTFMFDNNVNHLPVVSFPIRPQQFSYQYD